MKNADNGSSPGVKVANVTRTRFNVAKRRHMEVTAAVARNEKKKRTSTAGRQQWYEMQPYMFWPE